MSTDLQSIAPPAEEHPIDKGNTLYAVVFIAWLSIGAVGGSISTALIATCLAVPLIGWFIGLPIVLTGIAVAGTLWVMGLLCALVAIAPLVVVEKLKKGAIR